MYSLELLNVNCKTYLLNVIVIVNKLLLVFLPLNSIEICLSDIKNSLSTSLCSGFASLLLGSSIGYDNF